MMAARRLPAVASPQGNSPSGISVFTSTGFQNLSTKDYQNAVSMLRPDMAIPLADLTNGPTTPNSKRATRMADRTEDWLVQWLSSPQPPGPETAVFAPTLPVPYALQWEYLTRLSTDFSASISGLAVYSSDIIPDLANHSELASKPRLSLDPPATPHHVLRQIALGADVFLLPFLNSISDSGVALTFQFPIPSSPAAENSEARTTALLPLGRDLGDTGFAFAVEPLGEGCGCYTCTTHHAAYVHHLLSAREMLGWTLLQIHNHAAVSDFFRGVRESLAAGTFAEDSARFQTAYEEEVPAGTGERPRARGYHFKSEGGGESKRNKKAWDAKLGDGEEDGQEGNAAGVEGLRVAEVEKLRLERDLTETPVVPEGNAMELERDGFAQGEGRRA
jgi:queuine tRNA-ribosyltransferase